MSYEKGFLTTQDHAVGIQCVNRALDNNRALYFDQFDPNHSVGVGGTAYGDPFLGPGRHDDVLIARSVADYDIELSTTPNPTAHPIVTGPAIFGPPEYMEAGKWKIFITTPRFFLVQATIKETSIGVARTAIPWVSMDLNGPFVIVSTWNCAAGTRDNYDFSLAIWADGVA